MAKDFDDLTETEKIQLTVSSLKSFSDSLGPDDIYKQILLEELFRMLLCEGDDED